ncbi:multidrug DMT transporter permease [Desulfuromonas versatilis]|uniref:Multidrug DMT transporter permease n=1 Tax=Desulfuromonas versatilis TaxID=2802975 RepID=A0ABN6DSW6_9BACT|nr:DMT family transporter [Desulfuromonas versatilis]BCR03256.1 multidrug DMT transporter permease [Desulfuromonas versatilis]
MSRLRNNLGPYLLLSLPPLFWAGNAVLARGVADLIPPVALAFWRWAIALALVLPFTWRQVLRDLPQARQGWKALLLLGFTGIACFNTLLYAAAHTTSAINIALMQTAMPALIILITFVLFRERIGGHQAFGVALAMTGAIAIVLRGELRTFLELAFAQGDLLMLAATLLYALYSAMLRLRPAIHPLSLLTLTFLIGVVFLLPLYAWEALHTPAPPLNAKVLASLAYVAVFPSVLAYLCWNRGVERIGANRAGLFINLTPFFASAMAAFFLGETIRGYHLAGMTLILSGMLLFNRRRALGTR